MRLDRKLILVLLLVTVIMMTNLQTHADDKGLAPDIVIINAIVHTMDSRRPTAQALAISGNRIVAVGASKDIKKLAGARTRIIDARNQLLLPGFNDAHVHFLGGGFQLSSVDLRDANTTDEFAARI